MKKKLSILIALVISLFVLGYFFIVRKDSIQIPIQTQVFQIENSQNKKNENLVQTQFPLKEHLQAEKPDDSQPKSNKTSDVPFVLQAPFGNWDDPLFQDACEEASILMVDGWINNKTFTAQQAEDEIKKIVALENKMLGQHVDASAEDTAKVMKKYTGYEKIEVIKNIKLIDIKKEILNGNLVVVPTNGRKLKNPHYTAPGPLTHMIVVIDYDTSRKEFITNDSGTYKGKNYRYNENVLFNAIRDYPTGNHHERPIDENLFSEKNMIVILVAK